MEENIKLYLKLKDKFDFEIDITNIQLKGTPFQLKVWEAILKIPFGKTMTYGELAAQIGHPKAYRAVANACGKNQYPIIIPCHRICRKNNIGGYRYGVALKKWLLEYEKL